MARLEIRYDLRNPAAAGTSVAERYEAALEQIAWAEGLGIRTVTLSEHHGTEDGYLPSPLVFAAAVAARTTRIKIRVAALIAPLHDPLRIAEDAAVVDQLSRGRLELVIANGYVASEFAMFDKQLSERVPAVVEAIETLKAAWTGEPLEFRGRTVMVRPRPFREPRPPLFLGGGSAPAARRAARIADVFFPSDATHWETYRQAILDAGGPDYGEMPPVGPRFVHVAEDPEQGWAQVGPFVANDRGSYGRWASESGLDTGHREVTADNGLRDDPEYVVLTPQQCVAMIQDLGPSGTLPLNPMMGGIPPEIAWSSLRLFETEVLPRL
jgi:alkanesulfonate monooxygenase SsuD/methylene tetrahydromethanopterin reductase-like flavin-dependent oxidoreductase (luciferase family)